MQPTEKLQRVKYNFEMYIQNWIHAEFPVRIENPATSPYIFGKNAQNRVKCKETGNVGFVTKCQ